MSFGFSPSDIVLTAQLAWKTVQNSRKACGEYDELTREILSLHVVLQRLEQEAAKPDSPVNKRGDTCREELRTITSGCQKVLNQLDRVLEKYNGLSDTERSGRKLWQKIRFGNGEVVDIRDLRGKLVYYTSAISLFVNMVSMGSLGRVESQMNNAGGDLREIKVAVNSITAHLISKNNHEGSILTTHTNDDRSVWKEFRRELIDDGFKSDVIKRHKRLIKAYVKELGSRGLLDDEDPEDMLQPRRDPKLSDDTACEQAQIKIYDGLEACTTEPDPNAGQSTSLAVKPLVDPKAFTKPKRDSMPYAGSDTSRDDANDQGAGGRYAYAETVAESDLDFETFEDGCNGESSGAESVESRPFYEEPILEEEPNEDRDQQVEPSQISPQAKQSFPGSDTDEHNAYKDVRHSISIEDKQQATLADKDVEGWKDTTLTAKYLVDPQGQISLAASLDDKLGTAYETPQETTRRRKVARTPGEEIDAIEQMFETVYAPTCSELIGALVPIWTLYIDELRARGGRMRELPAASTKFQVMYMPLCERILTEIIYKLHAVRLDFIDAGLTIRKNRCIMDSNKTLRKLHQAATFGFIPQPSETHWQWWNSEMIWMPPHGIAKWLLKQRCSMRQSNDTEPGRTLEIHNQHLLIKGLEYTLDDPRLIGCYLPGWVYHFCKEGPWYAWLALERIWHSYHGYIAPRCLGWATGQFSISDEEKQRFEMLVKLLGSRSELLSSIDGASDPMLTARNDELMEDIGGMRRCMDLYIDAKPGSHGSYRWIDKRFRSKEGVFRRWRSQDDPKMEPTHRVTVEIVPDKRRIISRSGDYCDICRSPEDEDDLEVLLGDDDDVDELLGDEQPSAPY